MRQLQKKTGKYIREQHLLEAGDVVCVALSGGADSVCLLLLLEALQKEAEIPFSLCAVHIHHGLRPEADAEEAFVRTLCEKKQIPLYVHAYAVRERAAASGTGIEEAARAARQEAFADCVRTHGVTKIALAHQANDRAETFLFHAARGSSLSGLASIRPKSERSTEQVRYTLIRPLLTTTRDEIREALQKSGQPWMEDASNRDTQYTRNAIRHRVLPELEALQARAVTHMAAAAADLEEADLFFQKEAEKRLQTWAVLYQKEGKEDASSGNAAEELSSVLLPEEFRDEPALLQGYILLQVLAQIGGERKDLGREQVQQLRELFEKPVGKQNDLPYGLLAVRENCGVRIRQKNPYAVRIRKTPGVIQ